MSLFSGDGTGASEKTKRSEGDTLQLLSSLLYSHIIVFVVFVIVIVS